MTDFEPQEDWNTSTTSLDFMVYTCLESEILHIYDARVEAVSVPLQIQRVIVNGCYVDIAHNQVNGSLFSRAPFLHRLLDDDHVLLTDDGGDS